MVFQANLFIHNVVTLWEINNGQRYGLTAIVISTTERRSEKCVRLQDMNTLRQGTRAKR